MDISRALAPKSDQLDAADLIGSPPRIFTITDVSENDSDLADQQPVNIKLAEFPRVWRPSKGMLRVLADNWTKDVKVWIGRQVELYGDPNVYFGKEKRGGTRISRLSHITTSKTTLINPRGGRSAYWTVKPLPPTPGAGVNSSGPSPVSGRVAEKDVRTQQAGASVSPADVPAPAPDSLDTSSPLAKAMFAAIESARIPPAEALAFLSQVTGRPITASGDLTEDEARTVIEEADVISANLPAEGADQ